MPILPNRMSIWPNDMLLTGKRTYLAVENTRRKHKRHIYECPLIYAARLRYRCTYYTSVKRGGNLYQSFVVERLSSLSIKRAYVGYSRARRRKRYRQNRRQVRQGKRGQGIEHTRANRTETKLQASVSDCVGSPEAFQPGTDLRLSVRRFTANKASTRSRVCLKH